LSVCYSITERIPLYILRVGATKNIWTKLESYDEEWRHIGNEHKASFFKVPAGNHTLKIRAVNPDRERSEKNKHHHCAAMV
jgi:hypothetical protein